MQDTEVSIITRSEELPAMSCRNFFHSKELFHILEQTPGCSPYMCLVADSHGIIQAHILAIVFRRGSLLPPYLYSHARIYGEGEYRDGTKKDELFAQMLVVQRSLVVFADLLALVVDGTRRAGIDSHDGSSDGGLTRTGLAYQ